MMSENWNKSRTAINYTPHVLVWGFLFLFPLIFNEDALIDRKLWVRNWLPLTFYLIVFYFNFFYLIDRYLIRRRILEFILINVMVLFVALYALDFCKSLIMLPPRGRGHGLNRMLLLRNTFTMVLFMVISVAIKATQQWYAEEARRKKVENEHLKSELSYLHYQLQPHFFFNTLNNIYVLIEKEPVVAQESVHQLSKLMRYLLYEASTETVLLSKEIDFLKNYVELMKLRLSGQTSVRLNFPIVARPVKVVSLLFISLVENAFKHGVDSKSPSFIHIQMQLEENQLIFEVVNSNFPKTSSDKSGSGIGLVNLRKRLEIMYPDRHELVLDTTEKQFSARLTLNV